MKKKRLFDVVALLLFVLAGIISACKEVPPPASIKVTGITLNTDKLELMEGDTATLVANVQPKGATNDSVTWQSSDEAIVTVSPNGEVVAVAAGEAFITVTTTDEGKTADCAVTVSEYCPCIESGTPANPSDVMQWVEINTDKALYKPGKQVKFYLTAAPGGNVNVRYKHLDKTLSEHPLTATEWTWTPPATDFKGYMAELVDKSGSEEKILGTVGIDVSGDWKKFPRYGFLSKYGVLSDAQAEDVIANLNRYHINGLQYYDWLYKHHKPLAGTPEAPMEQWPDIFNRPTYRSTTLKYLAAAKKYGMKSMMYNLCFGAWKDAAADGVSEDWYIFTDRQLTNKDKHELTYGLSDIFLVDPNIPEWQDYMAKQNDDVYKVYDFDGYHMDQLGNRGTRYGVDGKTVDLAKGYPSFINAMRAAHPDKYLVMNVVSGYGITEINQGDIDFCYGEVWDNTSYGNYGSIINQNRLSKPNRPSTVFAAYINYNYKNTGATYFNTPGVLFADAVIFANGGAHLELGEHMLCSEYFPANNLQMSEELEKYLLSYYNFSVAYENLLRDGQEPNTPNLSTELSNPCGNVAFTFGVPGRGKIAVWGSKTGNRQVLHLINFTHPSAITDARDVDGKQKEPDLIGNIGLRLMVSGKVKNVWLASPDKNAGSPEYLAFCRHEDKITFTLPSLKYWDMVVVEYE